MIKILLESTQIREVKKDINLSCASDVTDNTQANKVIYLKMTKS